MSTIKGLLDKVKVLNTDIITAEVMKDNVEVLGEANKEQLYAGRTREGNFLRPTYQEDPYFDTYAQAQAYSDWKDKITPSPLRPAGVPNLIINGYYYESRHISVVGDKILYSSDYIEQEITNKYGDVINGLGGPWKVDFLRDFIGPQLKLEITKVTGLKFKR